MKPIEDRKGRQFQASQGETVGSDGWRSPFVALYVDGPRGGRTRYQLLPSQAKQLAAQLLSAAKGSDG